jgi:hypothetical protein
MCRLSATDLTVDLSYAPPIGTILSVHFHDHASGRLVEMVARAMVVGRRPSCDGHAPCELDLRVIDWS